MRITYLAFFSGQDINTLREEGADTNCFVSLIVDTRGTYKAAITRKIKTRTEVSVKDTSYEFFGSGKVTPKTPKKKKSLEEEMIEYFMLDVERHVPEDDTLSYIDARFSDIEKRKKEIANAWKNTKDNFWDDFNSSHNYGTMSWKKEENTFNKAKPLNTLLEEEEKPTNLDKVKVHAAVVRMLTCSLIVNTDKLDLKQWVTKHMTKMYEKIFPDNESFASWLDFIIDYTFCSLVPKEDAYSGKASIWDALLDELEKYSKYNPLVKKYYEEIEQYYY